MQVGADCGRSKYDQYVHLDMPLPCGLPEGKAASQLPPGNDNVAGVHLCLTSLGNSEFTCVQALLLVSKGPHWRWIQQQWKRCQAWFAGQAVAQSPSQWVSTVYLHRLDQIDALSWQWIDHHENLVEQVWHTQQGVFRRKRPPDVRDDPMRGQ